MMLKTTHAALIAVAPSIFVLAQLPDGAHDPRPVMPLPNACGDKCDVQFMGFYRRCEGLPDCVKNARHLTCQGDFSCSMNCGYTAPGCVNPPSSQNLSSSTSCSDAETSTATVISTIHRPLIDASLVTAEDYATTDAPASAVAMHQANYDLNPGPAFTGSVFSINDGPTATPSVPTAPTHSTKSLYAGALTTASSTLKGVETVMTHSAPTVTLASDFLSLASFLATAKTVPMLKTLWTNSSSIYTETAFGYENAPTGPALNTSANATGALGSTATSSSTLANDSAAMMTSYVAATHSPFALDSALASASHTGNGGTVQVLAIASLGLVGLMMTTLL